MKQEQVNKYQHIVNNALDRGNNLTDREEKKVRVNVYDIVKQAIKGEGSPGLGGRFIKKLYKKAYDHFLFKNFILRGAKIELTESEIQSLKKMFSDAMKASNQEWSDAEWVHNTFKPLMRVLDEVEQVNWQVRENLQNEENLCNLEKMKEISGACINDLLREWSKNKKDPYFPVAAQFTLTGDDGMDGDNFFISIAHLNSIHYKVATLMLYFLRPFLMKNPKKHKFMRTKYKGIAEPVTRYLGQMWHRTAYYDVFYFEALLDYLNSNGLDKDSKEFKTIFGIIENCVNYAITTSKEITISPNTGKKFPAITCIPDSTRGHLSNKNWKRKVELGFGKYLPDLDTTMVTLSMTQKYLGFIENKNIEYVNEKITNAAKEILNYPYVDIYGEYQVGGGNEKNPGTVIFNKHLDYKGAFVTWFEKIFDSSKGPERPFGNDIDPGLNIDFHESIYLNKDSFKIFEIQKRIETIRKNLNFHYNLVTGGKFGDETSHIYYLPEVYIFLFSRAYCAFKTQLTELEQKTIDPEEKYEEIKDILVDYILFDMASKTMNPWDAAIVVCALIRFGHDRESFAFKNALKVLVDHVGKGDKGHPYLPYEWNKMKTPTRIIVGSATITSALVLQAVSLARDYLYE